MTASKCVRAAARARLTRNPLWRALPPISRSLPHTFDNGATVDVLTFSCNVCTGDVEESRGALIPVDDAIPGAVVLVALSLCPHCDTFTAHESVIAPKDDRYVLVRTGDQVTDRFWVRLQSVAGADQFGE